MKKLQDYKEEYKKLRVKRNLSGDEAMEAVKQDGYALQYVSNQFFENDEEDIIELNGEKYKKIK